MPLLRFRLFGCKPVKSVPGVWASLSGEIFWCSKFTVEKLIPKKNIRGTRYTKIAYLIVTVPNRGGRPIPVHRLVLEAFKGPLPKGKVSRHLNNDSLDNRLCNLTYGTQKENWADAVKAGAIRRGSLRRNSKLLESQVSYIKGQLSCGVHTDWLADKFGVNQSTISSICSGRLWAHIPIPEAVLEGPKSPRRYKKPVVRTT